MPNGNLPTWLQNLMKSRKTTPTQSPTPSLTSLLGLVGGAMAGAQPQPTPGAAGPVGAAVMGLPGATDLPAMEDLPSYPEGHVPGFPGLERVQAEDKKLERKLPFTATAVDQPTAADLARLEATPEWLRRMVMGAGIAPAAEAMKTIEEQSTLFREPAPVQGAGIAPAAEAMDVIKERAGEPVEPLSIVEQIYRDMGVFPGAETTRVPLPAFWEEKLADLFRSMPEVLPPPTTWYDQGGGRSWFPWRGGGGGGSYIPKKAASRWWMNMSRWNI